MSLIATDSQTAFPGFPTRMVYLKHDVYRGRTYAKKLRFFTQKKEQATQIWKYTVRLLYAKKVTSHIKKCV